MNEPQELSSCKKLSQTRPLVSTCLLLSLTLLGACSSTPPRIEYRDRVVPQHLLTGPAAWVDPPLIVTEDLAQAYTDLKAAQRECVADFNTLANWARGSK